MAAPIKSYQHYYAGEVFETENAAYRRGKKDGAKDMEIELIKRGKALFDLAMQKSESLTASLVKVASDNNITIHEFHLKLDNWDCVNSLIVVDKNDFIDDKIDILYKSANDLSNQVNSDSFHWEYSITYASENLDLDKILSDGFTHRYEHIPRSRQTQ